MLASGSVDGSVVLWDVEQGARISEPLRREFPKDGYVYDHDQLNGLAFSPDGVLASGVCLTPVTLLDVGLDSWMETACAVANRNLTPDEWARYLRDEEYRATCP